MRGHTYFEGDLVLSFHEIQFFRNGLIILESTFTYGKQSFNGVLHTFVNVAFVENTTETFEDRVQALRGQFLQQLTHFFDEINGNLHTVIVSKKVAEVRFKVELVRIIQ